MPKAIRMQPNPKTKPEPKATQPVPLLLLFEPFYSIKIISFAIAFLSSMWYPRFSFKKKLVDYSYKQGVFSFHGVHLLRTPHLSVLGGEQS